MKHIVVIFCIFCACATANSQSLTDKFKKAVDDKEYVEALGYTSEIVRNNPTDNNFLLMAADVYNEMNLHDSAVSVLKMALENNDNDMNLYRELAISQAQAEKFTTALSTMNKLLKKKNQDKEAVNFITLSNVYLLADSLDNAEYNLLKARELDSKNAEVYIGLGDLYYAKKIYELAKDNYESAISNDGKSLTQKALLNAKIKLASSYYKLGNMEMDQQLSNEYFRRSLNTWNEITKADPKNATAFYEQGKIFYLASKFNEAGASFNRYAALRPEGWLGRWYGAQSWYTARKYDSAVIQLEAVRTKIDTITVKATGMLAHSYFEVKKFNESINLYKSMTDIDQTSYERMGYAAFFSKDTLTAIEAFNKAIYGAEKKCNTMLKFGNLLQSMKKYEDAITVFKKRITDCDDSNSVKCKFFIGTSYYLSNKLDSSISMFREYLTLDPESISARTYMANAFNGMKKSDSSKKYLGQAIDMVQKSFQADPANQSLKKEADQAYDAACRSSLEAKDYSTVIKYAKQWIDINDKSATPHVYLGFAYQSGSDSGNACKAYSEALKRDPNNVAASKNKKALNCP